MEPITNSWTEPKRLEVALLVVDLTIYVPTDGNGTPRVFVALSDKTVQVWDLDGSLLGTITNLHTGAAIKQIRQAGNRIVTGGLNGELALVEPEAPYNVIKRQRAHRRIVACVDATHDLIASGGFDGIVALFNGDLEPLGTTSFHTGITVLALCQYQGTQALVVGSHDSPSLSILDINGLGILHRIDLLDAAFATNTFTPMGLLVDSTAGTYVVATNHTPYMRLIEGNLEEGTPSRNLLTLVEQTKFSDPVLATSGKGTALVTSDAGHLCELHLGDGAIISNVSAHSDRARALCARTWSEKRIIASGGADGVVYVWQLTA